MIEKYEIVFGVNIWVWKLDLEGRRPLVAYSSKRRYERDVLLLHLTNKEGNGHYVWVKNASALVVRHTSTKDENHNARFVCYNCTHVSFTESAHGFHYRDCVLHDGGAITMPAACSRQKKCEPDEDYEARKAKAGRPREKFREHHAILDVPAYIVFDFEADTVKRLDVDLQKSTSVVGDQLMNSAMILVVDNITKAIIHQEIFDGRTPVEGLDCRECRAQGVCASHRRPARQLEDSIKLWSFRVYEQYFSKTVPLKLTPEDRAWLCKATHCCICDGPLREKKCTCPALVRIEEHSQATSTAHWSLKGGFDMREESDGDDDDDEAIIKPTDEVQCDDRDGPPPENDGPPPEEDGPPDENEAPPDEVPYEVRAKACRCVDRRCYCGEGDFAEEHHNDMCMAVHHCHYSGEIYGAAHQSCNLATKVRNVVPVLAHNFKGYDLHPILREMSSSDYDKIDVIPDNGESIKHMTWTICDHKTIDTLKAGLNTRYDGWRIKSSKDKTVIDPLGNECNSKTAFYAICKNIQILQKMKKCEYKIAFKDSLLFLQCSLDKAAKSLDDDDFTETRSYVDRIAPTDPDHLRELLDAQCLRADHPEDVNDVNRLAFYKMVTKIMGWGEDLLQKADDFQDSKRKARYKAAAENCARQAYDAFYASPDPKLFSFKLCRRKGVYMYEYMDGPKRFEETQLPPVEAFISRLTHNTDKLADLSDKQRSALEDDHRFASLVWTWFGHRTIRDFHNHYLSLDCFQLVDVFQKFRSFFRESFDLEPLHFTTLPAAAWAAVKKFSKCNFELFGPGEEDMYLFCEDDIRGGVSTVGTMRHATANHKHLKHFNPHDPVSWNMYVDANALYATIMTLLLPYGGHKWVAELLEWFKSFMDIDTEGKVGYIAEVEVHIPRCVKLCDSKFAKYRSKLFKEVECTGLGDCTCLHDHHKEYPCLPDNIRIPYSEQSSAQQELSGKKPHHKNADPMGDPKLMPNLLPKKHYKVHLKALQLAVRQGWDVTAVHRVLQFNQKAWLKDYIEFNLRKRRAAIECKDAFGKEFFKLMNNIIFGKTMEDVRNYSKVEVVKKTGEEEKYRKIITTRFLRSPEEFDVNHELMFVPLAKKTILLNRPIIVGAVILDLSKHLMQDFWYNTLVPKYGRHLSMVYTDTDSFIFNVTMAAGSDFDLNHDVSTDLKPHFDLSSFPHDHPMYDNSREGAIVKANQEPGVFKIEHVKYLADVVALRSKMYSLHLEDGDQTEHKVVAKGCPKVAHCTMFHLNYMRALYHKGNPILQRQSRGFFNLQSRRHHIRLVYQNKIALCSFNDKSYLCPDGTQLPWGHASIDHHRTVPYYRPAAW